MSPTPCVSVSIINNRKRKEWSTGARIYLDRGALRISVGAGVHESCVHVWPRIIWRISGEGGNRTNSLVPSNIEISNSLRVPFFPCATFESRFDALAFPGPMRRDRARCSVQDEEKDQHHHAQGTWQERRRPRWYLCSRVYVSIPFARTSSSSWRYVLGVYEYYPSLLPSRSLFVPRGSTAARTRATTSSNWSPEEKEMRGLLLSSNLASLRFFPSFSSSSSSSSSSRDPSLVFFVFRRVKVERREQSKGETREGRKEGGGERRERQRGIRRTRQKRERGTERRSGFEARGRRPGTKGRWKSIRRLCRRHVAPGDDKKPDATVAQGQRYRQRRLLQRLDWPITDYTRCTLKRCTGNEIPGDRLPAHRSSTYA